MRKRAPLTDNLRPCFPDDLDPTPPGQYLIAASSGNDILPPITITCTSLDEAISQARAYARDILPSDASRKRVAVVYRLEAGLFGPITTSLYRGIVDDFVPSPPLTPPPTNGN